MDVLSDVTLIDVYNILIYILFTLLFITCLYFISYLVS